jgi:hypothetical protein
MIKATIPTSSAIRSRSNKLLDFLAYERVVPELKLYILHFDFA